MFGRRVITVALTTVLCSTAALAQTTSELKRMSLEDLLKVPVTTVTRTPQEAADVPAAVFVITQDDIRRSGATSIPEALRLAPGVEVSRISAGTWSIGVRGFPDRLARSMLVLIDGRAVYSPLFAGTYWETQNVLLADVDRIEVIRGPGGTLWGANAVNGIINIITKSAADTQGLLVTADGGSELRGGGAVRYGGRSGATSYRAYAQGFDRVSEFHPDGLDYDHWRTAQAGFRMDRQVSNGSFTLQGDAYDGRLGERPTVALYTSPFFQTTNQSAALSGGNLLGRLSRNAGRKGSYQLQMYYDRTNRDEIPIGERRDTVDVDFQDTMPAWKRHVLVWGGGYRVTSGRITAVAPSAFTPDTRTDNLVSAFVQDEIDVVPARLRLTIGSKFEHNSYSGFEAQPSGRLLWTPDRVDTFFASVSRAVRTPSRVETDYTTASFVRAAPTPTFVQLLPNPDFVSEKVIAYESGYRAKLGSRAYATVSGFYNSLDDLLTTELLTSFVETDPVPRLVLPVQFRNGLHGNSHGAELTGDVRPTPWWRLTGSYSYLQVAVTEDAGSTDVSQQARYEGLIPHHQARVGASFDLPRGISFDVQARHVSKLSQAPIPAYTTADVRVGWQATPSVELSIVGQDLLDPRHVEWPSGAGANIGIERSAYVGITIRR